MTRDEWDRFEKVPDGLWVLHKCDNRRCVNPDHLFLGTNADNVKDRDAKGRGVTPRRRLVDYVCPKGHDPADLTIGKIKKGRYSVRICRVCRSGINRRNYERRMMNRTAEVE